METKPESLEQVTMPHSNPIDVMQDVTAYHSFWTLVNNRYPNTIRPEEIEKQALKIPKILS